MADHPSSTHPLIEEMQAALSATQREFFEERAGILQYDAALSRALAEALALLEVIRRDGWPVEG